MCSEYEGIRFADSKLATVRPQHVRELRLEFISPPIPSHGIGAALDRPGGVILGKVSKI